MSLAAEHYRALLVEKKLPSAMNAEEAAQTLRDIVTETQQLTLSQLNTSTAKQLGSILFSHEGGLVSALGTINKPEIVKSPHRQKPVINLALLALGMLTAIAAVCLTWDAEQYLWSIFILFSALLFDGAYFAPRRQDKPELSQTVNTEQLFSLTERRMEAIDRDLDAFMSIPTEPMSADDSIVHLISLANKLKMEDPESVPDELMTAITALSISNGYDFIEYSDEVSDLFDVMPTKRESRTIVPAVMKNGSLIARGMAIVTMTPETEDN